MPDKENPFADVLARQEAETSDAARPTRLNFIRQLLANSWN